MHQTIYIDVDEEITGILDRVRQEQAVELFLVVPKGAMLVNSIINLKLLKKEAEKMGKSITIVAPNDKRSKNIIERSGIKVELYNEQSAKQLLNSVPSQTSVDQNVKQASEEAVQETKQELDKSNVNLGSNSFFGISGQQQLIQNNNDIGLIKHKIHNKSLTEEDKVYSPRLNNPEIRNQEQTIEEKEASYFNSPSVGNNTVDNSPEHSSKKRRFKFNFLLLGGVALVVILLGVISWFFFNYPKLELVIHPLEQKIDQEIKFTAEDGVEKIDFDKQIIPGKYLEMSVDKTMEFESTGSKIIDKNAGVAKGKVTIYNYFSESPQTLVKTTRVLSKKDKKLFRLSKTVTVPGMKDDEPGKITVAVYADKPGEDFNIGPDEFTIEGFKSKPEKYKKFKVKSETKMTGGLLSDNAQERRVVTKTDLDKARKETIDALDKSIIQEINKRLSPGQETVMDSISKEVVSSKSSYPEGATTDKFSYTVTYKVKLIAFNKRDAHAIAEAIAKEKLPENYDIDSDFRVDTKRGILDVDKKSLTVYADISGIAWAKINKNKLKEAIVGMDTETTRQALNKKAGIKSAEIRPSPTWLKKSPKKMDKINIKVIREKE